MNKKSYIILVLIVLILVYCIVLYINKNQTENTDLPSGDNDNNISSNILSGDNNKYDFYEDGDFLIFYGDDREYDCIYVYKR